jgi:hypothetical protein
LFGADGFWNDGFNLTAPPQGDCQVNWRRP